MALASSQPDFKISAQQFIGRSDALVFVESRLGMRAWPALDFRELDNKPVFQVSAPDYFNPKLCHFVWGRLPLQVSEASSVSGE